MKRLIFVIITGLLLNCSNNHSQKKEAWDVIARQEMVQTQIISRGIKDQNVISALLKVKRHKFVPKKYEKLAYIDGPLPIGEDQTISQPYIVALMTEKLELKSGDRVLEIGTGSGYQAAILSLIVQEVYTIEILPKLAETAKKRLKALGYNNVYVKCGDGFLGWPEKAPFDAIIITCATPEIPAPLIEQLADSGRLILPQGEETQTLTLYRKIGKNLKKEELIPVLFVPMKGIIREEH